MELHQGVVSKAARRLTTGGAGERRRVDTEMQNIEEMTETVSRMLEQELRQRESSGGDLKRLRELSGLMKDMSALRTELSAGGSREVVVEFVGDAARAGE